MVAGERFYLDLSTIKRPKELKTIGKSNWLMIVDELSKLKFSSFHYTKNVMVEPICVFFKCLQQNEYPVSFIRCNNAGENKMLDKHSNSAA